MLQRFTISLAAALLAASAVAQDIGSDPLPPPTPKNTSECYAYGTEMGRRISALQRQHDACSMEVYRYWNSCGTLEQQNACAAAERNPMYNPADANTPYSLYTRCQYLKDAYRRAEASRKSNVSECLRLAEAAENADRASKANGGGSTSTGSGSSNGGSTGTRRTGPVTPDQVPGAGAIAAIKNAILGLAAPRDATPREPTREPAEAGDRRSEPASPAFQPLLGGAGDSAASNNPAFNNAVDDLLNTPSASGGSWTEPIVSYLKLREPWESLPFNMMVGVGAGPASIPFALLSPIFEANTLVLDDLSNVLNNFENAHSSDVERIWGNYQARVLDPEQWLKRIAVETAVGVVAHEVSERVVMPVLNPTVTDAQPTTFFWWSERTRLSGDHLRRDASGVPLLRDSSGSLHAYNPATNAVRYSRGEAEALVASGHYTPIRDQRTVSQWERNSVTFLPTERERLSPASEALVSSAAEAWIGWHLQLALDEAEQTSQRTGQRVNERLTALKKWLDEEKRRINEAR